MANAPVPVTEIANIKIPVDLKLQLRTHAGSLIFTYITNDTLFMHRIKKHNSVSNFFSNLTIIYFLPVLQLQADWMRIYR